MRGENFTDGAQFPLVPCHNSDDSLSGNGLASISISANAAARNTKVWLPRRPITRRSFRVLSHFPIIWNTLTKWNSKH